MIRFVDTCLCITRGTFFLRRGDTEINDICNNRGTRKKEPSNFRRANEKKKTSLTVNDYRS